MNHLPIVKTQRGFPTTKITDFYGKELLITWSSIADPECLWLGPNHLTREQVAQILPVLIAFAKQGYDFNPDANPDCSAFAPPWLGQVCE